jgi:hypothetical protein
LISGGIIKAPVVQHRPFLFSRKSEPSGLDDFREGAPLTVAEAAAPAMSVAAVDASIL